MGNGENSILAVDSDGCALDAMEIKHRRCFTPAIIRTWSLEPITDVVERGSLRINLYSNWRGVNRFVALARLFRWLPVAVEDPKGMPLPRFAALDSWIAQGSALSEESLIARIAEVNEEDAFELKQVLAWTREVNRSVAELLPPPAFAAVASTLAKAVDRGLSVFVVSSATREAIRREWSEAGIADAVVAFFGQEDGSKTEILRRLVLRSGHASRLLMVGDAPGDLEAARAAHARFFPIIPGSENDSWTALRDTVLAVYPPAFPPAEWVDAWQARFRRALPDVEAALAGGELSAANAS